MRTFRLSGLLLLLYLPAARAELGEAAWRDDSSIGAVKVQTQPTASGFDRVRASVVVCANLQKVSDYAADASTLIDWVAYAEAVELLEKDAAHTLYYMKTAAPWPMRSRDMIYELRSHFDDAGSLHVSMIGMPDALPPRADAIRMDSVEGEWVFNADGEETHVQLTLYTVPGKVPKFMANRRIIGSVGLTLAALAEKFPCSTSLKTSSDRD